MIVGIGCDLTSLERWQDSEKREKIMTRFFSPEEQAYVRSRGRAAAESAGGIFAAKEALVKALGTGFDGIPLPDICVSHTEKGAPVYRLTGMAARAADTLNAVRRHLSITHDGGMAMAFCVLEDEPEGNR